MIIVVCCSPPTSGAHLCLVKLRRAATWKSTQIAHVERLPLCRRAARPSDALKLIVAACGRRSHIVFCELLELPRPHAAGETQAMTKGLQYQGPACVKLLKQCTVLITLLGLPPGNTRISDKSRRGPKMTSNEHQGGQAGGTEADPRILLRAFVDGVGQTIPHV